MIDLLPKSQQRTVHAVPKAASPAQEDRGGRYYVGKAEDVLRSGPLTDIRGKVQLIVTSPPFPLNEKKSYGNLQGDRYLEWLSSFGPIWEDLLTTDGSVVIEIGNAWEPGRPVQSLLPLRALMALADRKGSRLRLIQEFVCYNPSRLPSPAQWVTVQRIRTVDSFTHVWWLANTDHPKAHNEKVLRPYSDSMRLLHKRGTFNSGRRPSHHDVNVRGFLKDCGGSIAHNFLELEPLDPKRSVRLPRLPNALSFSNTASNDRFSRQCAARGIIPHPARMPVGLAAFFIAYLTDPGDLVLDPFAGSNTTGYAAAKLGRRWLAVDADKEYVQQSRIRFSDAVFQEDHELGNRATNSKDRSLQTKP